MEIKINKEIRQYAESVFFGLSARQFFCSLLAAGTAVILFFLFHSRLGTELTSWFCVLGAAPFAAAGFITYHGMPAEKLFAVWIRSEFLEPSELPSVPRNLYKELEEGREASKC